jgi:hypothetical protein
VWITFSLFLQYSYVLASVQCENFSHNDKSFPVIPNMPESIGPKFLGLCPPDNLGSGHTITRYVCVFFLQYIGIDTIIL